MKRLAVGLAFLTSVAAFLVVVGGGLVLLVIENSGERGAGALLALSGAIAFAAALILIFARAGALAGPRGRAGAVIAALLGVLPVATLSLGAFRFSGVPVGSAVPLIDWTAFAVGVVFAAGAVSVAATGYWRMNEAQPARARPEAVRPSQAPTPEPAPARPVAPSAEGSPSARRSLEVERLAQRPAPVFDEEEVRVTPVVELPSLAQFRRR